MRENLMQRQGDGVAAPAVGNGWPVVDAASQGRTGGRFLGTVRSVATDLGDRGVRIALALAACIAALAVLGAAAQLAVELPAFDLSGEVGQLGTGINVPALFSGAILLTASAVAVAAASHSERLPWIALAALFAFMALDEVLMIHEHLDRSGIAWQILYLPLVIAGGLYWLAALRRMRRLDSEWMLWLGGAACWILAQLIELVINGGVLHSVPLGTEVSGIEEVLEMAGSAMFLLALYLMGTRLAARVPRLSRHHARA